MSPLMLLQQPPKGSTSQASLQHQPLHLLSHSYRPGKSAQGNNMGLKQQRPPGLPPLGNKGGDASPVLKGLTSPSARASAGKGLQSKEGKPAAQLGSSLAD